MAGPLALKNHFAEHPARWAGLGKLLGHWPVKTKSAQHQKAQATGLDVVVVVGSWFNADGSLQLLQ